MNVEKLISELKCFNPKAKVGVKTIDDLYVDDVGISYMQG